MLAAMYNRKVVVFLLCAVCALLLVTLYKMETFTTFFKQELVKEGVYYQPQPTRPPLPKTLLETRKEQEVEGQKLYQLMINDPVQYTCKEVRLIKNRGEGVWHYCGDDGFDLKPPCLVYSFGINYDFTFDDEIGKRGCDVYSFDPSMTTKDHRRNEHVMFSRTGLDGTDNDSYVPRFDGYVKEKTTWKMRTLKTIMKELGHSNRNIDLLKIDIESSEWAVAENLLNSSAFDQVKQFLVEWHIFPEYPPRQTFRQLSSVLARLKEIGVLSFHKNPHPTNMKWEEFNLQSDMGYVNTKFFKSGKPSVGL